MGNSNSALKETTVAEMVTWSRRKQAKYAESDYKHKIKSKDFLDSLDYCTERITPDVWAGRIEKPHQLGNLALVAQTHGGKYQKYYKRVVGALKSP